MPTEMCGSRLADAIVTNASGSADSHVAPPSARPLSSNPAWWSSPDGLPLAASRRLSLTPPQPHRRACCHVLCSATFLRCSRPAAPCSRLESGRGVTFGWSHICPHVATPHSSLPECTAPCPMSHEPAALRFELSMLNEMCLHRTVCVMKCVLLEECGGARNYVGHYHAQWIVRYLHPPADLHGR